MIRFILFVALAGALAYCGATVKLGNRTLFGHIRAIWHTEEVQDLEQGVKQTAEPAVERVKRGVEAGYHAMKHDGSTKWISLDPLGLEAEVPSCARVQPSEHGVVVMGTGRAECQVPEITIAKHVGRGAAAIADLAAAFDRLEPKPQVTRQDDTADGRIVEYIQPGPNGIRVELAYATIDGATYVCTNLPHPNDDLGVVRRACESLRMAK